MTMNTMDDAAQTRFDALMKKWAPFSLVAHRLYPATRPRYLHIETSQDSSRSHVRKAHPLGFTVVTSDDYEEDANTTGTTVCVDADLFAARYNRAWRLVRKEVKDHKNVFTLLNPRDLSDDDWARITAGASGDSDHIDALIYGATNPKE